MYKYVFKLVIGRKFLNLVNIRRNFQDLSIKKNSFFEASKNCNVWKKKIFDAEVISLF